MRTTLLAIVPLLAAALAVPVDAQTVGPVCVEDLPVIGDGPPIIGEGPPITVGGIPLPGDGPDEGPEPDENESFCASVTVSDCNPGVRVWAEVGDAQAFTACPVLPVSDCPPGTTGVALRPGTDTEPQICIGVGSCPPPYRGVAVYVLPVTGQGFTLQSETCAAPCPSPMTGIVTPTTQACAYDCQFAGYPGATGAGIGSMAVCAEPCGSPVMVTGVLVNGDGICQRNPWCSPPQTWPSGGDPGVVWPITVCTGPLPQGTVAACAPAMLGLGQGVYWGGVLIACL